ncbi:MAG: hypothetical protein ACFFDK_13485 [Promethearchaeota archaeon]
MYSIDPEKVKELEFTHLKFRHKLIYGRLNRWTHGNIQVNLSCPEICVVCGERYIVKKYVVTDIDDLSVFYTKIGLCKLHRKPERSSLKLNLFIGFMGMFAFVLVFSIIVKNLIEILTIIVISLFMYVFCAVLIILTTPMFDREKMLKNYINFHFLSDYTVVSVKNPIWINEFSRLNDCFKISPELSEFEEMQKEARGIKRLLIFCLIGLIVSFGPIYLIFVMNPIINLERLFSVFIALIVVNIFFLGYYHFKMQSKLRELRKIAYF